MCVRNCLYKLMNFLRNFQIPGKRYAGMQGMIPAQKT